MANRLSTPPDGHGDQGVEAPRGHQPAAVLERTRWKWVYAGESLFTTVVNIEEIHRGLRSAREREAADRLLGGLRLAPLGRVEGARAGEWRCAHADRGITLSQADCLIAAGAVAVGARLATGNPNHFPMRGVTVEHWQAGV